MGMHVDTYQWLWDRFKTGSFRSLLSTWSTAYLNRAVDEAHPRFNALQIMSPHVMFWNGLSFARSKPALSRSVYQVHRHSPLSATGIHGPQYQRPLQSPRWVVSVVALFYMVPSGLRVSEFATLRRLHKIIETSRNRSRFQIRLALLSGYILAVQCAWSGHSRRCVCFIPTGENSAAHIFCHICGN